jgi:hypothetical protein
LRWFAVLRDGIADKARQIARPGAATALTAYEQLTANRRRFVDEYLIDLNGHQSARRAGLSAKTAYTLLSNALVIAAIKERRALLDSERSIQGARHVLNKLWDIETADPRDLCEIWKVPCRFCWGINGQYQFTATEMRRRLQAHELGIEQKPIETLWPRGPAELAAWTSGVSGLVLDPQGGDGYTTKREPNPTCTECGGDGTIIQHITDTRHLSPGARALYRGVKVTKEGQFEVLMADQAFAREMLARHYGVAVERKRILVRKLNPDELSDEELVQTLEELETLNGAAVDAADDVTDADYQVVDEPEPVKPKRPKKRHLTPPAHRKQHRRWHKRPKIVRPS